jgi:hypothetical protein
MRRAALSTAAWSTRRALSSPARSRHERMPRRVSCTTRFSTESPRREFGAANDTPVGVGQHVRDPSVDDGIRNIGGSDCLPPEIKGDHAVVW